MYYRISVLCLGGRCLEYPGSNVITVHVSLWVRKWGDSSDTHVPGVSMSDWPALVKLAMGATSPLSLSTVKTKQNNLKLRTLGKAHMGVHDLMRVVAANGETLIWCRKCSGNSRCRLGHKLSNGIEDCQRALANEEHDRSAGEGRIPARRDKRWKIEGEKKQTTRKEHRMFKKEDFQDGGMMAQKEILDSKEEESCPNKYMTRCMCTRS